MVEVVISMRNFLLIQMFEVWYWWMFASALFGFLIMTVIYLIGSIWTVKENHDRELDGVNGRAINRSFINFRRFFILDIVLLLILFFASRN